MKLQLKRLLILSWTLAVFYIHLASLVNFHQNRIWKKALCYELVAAHRDNKQQHSVLKVKMNPGAAQQQFLLENTMQNLTLDIPGYQVVVTEFAAYSSLPLQQSRCTLGLRGPPIA